MGPTPERIMLAHGQDPWSSATSSASGSACSGLDPFARLYIHTAKIIQGILVVTSILQPLAETSSLTSSATSPKPDSSDVYPKIGVGTYGDFVIDSCLICMVAPNGTHRATAPADIVPLRDRRCLMPIYTMVDCSKI
jgi:hypothetical protein